MAIVTTTQTFISSLTGTAFDSLATGVSFSSIRSAAGNVASTGALDATLTGYTTSNTYKLLARGFILFDTTNIPSNATITNATITLTPTGYNLGLGTTDIEIVSSNPASTTALAASDYSTLGTTSFASSTIAGNFDAVVFTLNSSGIANITQGGISKFGLRTTWDMSGSFTGTWASGASTDNSFDIDTSLPVLSVTYTQPTLAITGTTSITGISSITTS